MKKPSFILSLICILSSASYAQSPLPEKITLPVTHTYELTQVYTDTVNKFSISFPTNWELAPNYEGAAIAAAGPKLDPKKQARDGSFALAVIDLKKEYSAQAWFEGSMQRVRKNFPDVMIMELADLDLNGTPAIFVYNKATISKKETFTTQIYFTIGTNAYIMNGSNSNGHPKEHHDLYIEMARTFKLLK